MSRFFSRIVVILCVLALAGCGYYAEDAHFVEESIISKRLKEISVGEYEYLRDIYGGQWEQICVLPPYYGGVIGLSDEKKEAFIDEKIIQSGLVISEVTWHLVFFRNAPFDEYFDYVSFRIRGLNIQQINFLEKQTEDFKRVGFSPSYCADINQATIFKFEHRWREEDAHTHITLGVIDQ